MMFVLVIDPSEMRVQSRVRLSALVVYVTARLRMFSPICALLWINFAGDTSSSRLIASSLLLSCNY
jgi:hypothetical protein